MTGPDEIGKRIEPTLSHAISDNPQADRSEAQVRRYAALSFLISQKRLINPTTTGISPTSVQTKSEPDAALAATTTIQTPKAISPTEIKYERAVSMASTLVARKAARVGLAITPAASACASGSRATAPTTC